VGFCPVLIIIILVDYLNTIQWSNSLQVAWVVLPALWWLNLSPEFNAAVPREKLAGAFNIPRAGCKRIGAINLIPESTGIIPPPIDQLNSGFVKHLHHIYAEGSPPLTKWRTPARAVRQHQLEL
jgi:hypothetical protein